jgi:hypothetical protein
MIGILAHYRRDVLRIITESYNSIHVMQAINRDLALQSAAAISGLFNNTSFSGQAIVILGFSE